jgi:hypothetical protein
LRWPLLRIDDVVGFIPLAMRERADPFWDTMIQILLNLAEVQLELGVSVVIDSVFMGDDRQLAQQIAARYQAAYRPIYTYLSDEAIWRARVERRLAEAAPEDGVASWERIQQQRKAFQPWPPGSALCVDGVLPVEDNLAWVIAFITNPSLLTENGEDDQ